jgi:hypothetical protein
MLTVLGGLADFERELVRARTSEGRSRAKARVVKMVARRSLLRTKSRRRCAATMPGSLCARSRKAITFRTARFRDWRNEYAN